MPLCGIFDTWPLHIIFPTITLGSLPFTLGRSQRGKRLAAKTLSYLSMTRRISLKAMVIHRLMYVPRVPAILIAKKTCQAGEGAVNHQRCKKIRRRFESHANSR